MSGIFDHELDAWESYYDGYLDHELDEPYFSKPYERDEWKFHGWYKLSAFHKDFEKAILATIWINQTEATYVIPKSIIGKLETTVNFKTGYSTSRYLIHTNTLRKLDRVEVTYAQDTEDFKFIATSFDGRYCLRNAKREIDVTPDKVQYVRWSKMEIKK